MSALLFGIVMKNDIVDIHCHILPDLDDGSKNMEMTKELLAYSYGQGVRGICFTPHDYDRRSHSDVTQKRQAFEAVQAYCRETYPDLDTWLGTEVTYRRGVEEDLKKGRTLSLAGGRWVLIEFFPGESLKEIQYGLRMLQQYGYEPLVAHVERVEVLFKDPDQIWNLRDREIHFQMNTQSIVGSVFDGRVRRCRQLVKDGLIDCFGTDAHNMDSRKPDYEAAYQWMLKHIGEERTLEITSRNARRMLEQVRK